jgi:hypothetical protein
VNTSLAMVRQQVLEHTGLGLCIGRALSVSMLTEVARVADFEYARSFESYLVAECPRTCKNHCTHAFRRCINFAK